MRCVSPLINFKGTKTLKTAFYSKILNTKRLTEDSAPLEPELNVSFESGNYAQLDLSLKEMIKKPALISKTIIPLIEKALIELLGTSSAYKRKLFNYSVVLENKKIAYACSVEYAVDLFIGSDIDNSAVEHDTKYITDTLAVVNGLRITNSKIDTSTGIVHIEFVV